MGRLEAEVDEKAGEAFLGALRELVAGGRLPLADGKKLFDHRAGRSWLPAPLYAALVRQDRRSLAPGDPVAEFIPYARGDMTVAGQPAVPASPLVIQPPSGKPGGRRLPSVFGTVEEITDKTITVGGVKYVLGGHDGRVHIWAKGKSGGAADWIVSPGDVKKHIQVGDKIQACTCIATDAGGGRDNIWYIYLR
jgi:hypothetical protein